MSDMPKEIWAAQSSDGSSYWLSEFHAAIDQRPHAKGRNQTAYIRKDPDTITLTREELEGMKHSDAAAQNGYYCTGYNAAIDAILEKM